MIPPSNYAKRPDLTEADQMADQYMISRRFGETNMALNDISEALWQIVKLLKPAKPAKKPAKKRRRQGENRRRRNIPKP